METGSKALHFDGKLRLKRKEDMMNFKAVLFDGYGTLFEDAMIPLMEACEVIIQRNGLTMEADSFLAAWDEY